MQQLAIAFTHTAGSHSGRGFAQAQRRRDRGISRRFRSSDEFLQEMKLLRFSGTFHLALQPCQDAAQQCDRPLPFVDLLGRQRVLWFTPVSVLRLKIDRECQLSTTTFVRGRLVTFFRQEALEGSNQEGPESPLLRVGIGQILLLQKPLKEGLR